jgi:Asp/Glu/hydantoin racemase
MTVISYFHTGAGLSGRFDELHREFVPEAEYFHQVDESVLDDLLEAGELTPGVTRRICSQLALAEDAGADIVLDTCSSTSPAADTARELVDIPVLKIDDPLMERAVEVGEAVAVIATASSTLGPSTDLIERKAAEVDDAPDITSTLVEGALEARNDGNMERHDELVRERAADLADGVDVIVLAQASMSHLDDEIEAETGVTTLSSPELAMERLAAFVEEGESALSL